MCDCEIKEKILGYINRKYGAEPEYLWSRYPDAAAFRHKSNRKWFALLMTVERKNIGLSGNGKTDILNLKCGKLMIGSMLADGRFLPGYHMNKSNWITAPLDGRLTFDEIAAVIDISFDITRAKK